jgi:hypothetical protein
VPRTKNPFTGHCCQEIQATTECSVLHGNNHHHGHGTFGKLARDDLYPMRWIQLCYLNVKKEFALLLHVRLACPTSDSAIQLLAGLVHE